ncbi:hypothetical protein B0T21DRAFT_395086 [Apiosordaria backusii]|uniref:F-box domain-containing protein n=1 Tax=Apiosordaria backusii TaxID=314023 RepID=A0AA40E8T9_9PEZI|nr:hypothetical protein B0T21DRAFT_395086 [Apiosordaria backusii]
MAPPLFSLLNVYLALWAILDELDIDDGITSLSLTCRALHEHLFPYLESRVRRRFNHTPAGLTAAIKLARLGELERQGPRGLDSRHFCHTPRLEHGYYDPVYTRPEVSEHSYCCQPQYVNFQIFLRMNPARKKKFDAISDILQPYPVIGLDEMLKQLEPNTRGDELRKLRFLSDLCRLHQLSTKFIEGFLAHQAWTVDKITPLVPPEREWVYGPHLLSVPKWVEIAEVRDLAQATIWESLLHHREGPERDEEMRSMYRRWERAFSWVKDAIGPNRRPLSHTERSRIERAFFRLETHSLLHAMLMHEPQPQYRLAMCQFAGGMRDWEVEEMMTVSHMVENSLWYGLRTLVTSSECRDVNPREKPRTYYDPYILASLRRYDQMKFKFSVPEGSRSFSTVVDGDIGFNLPEGNNFSPTGSDVKYTEAQQPNHAWLCYADSTSSPLSRLLQIRHGAVKQLSNPVVLHCDTSGRYRSFGWSLLDRDTVEQLHLDRTGSFGAMLDGVYMHSVGRGNGDEEQVQVLMQIGWYQRKPMPIKAYEFLYGTQGSVDTSS